MEQINTVILMFSQLFIESAMFIPVFETNKPVPVREESLILSCFPVAVFKFGNILWHHPGDTELSRCYSFGGGICNLNTSSYAFTANSSGSYAFIHSLNRTRDSGLWQCAYPDVGWLNQTVVVFTSPIGVKLVPSLSSVIDLGIESLTLKCQTVNCTFPAPNITWYIYNMTTTLISPYTGPSITLESDTSPCTEQEAVYTSTLQLPHGTTFQGNIPLTTKFLCGLEHPTLGQKVEYSQQSINVTFAAMFIPSLETNKPVPVREESLVLSCLPVPVFNTSNILWYHPTGTFLSRCFSFGFCSGNNSSYTFTANSTGSYAFIHSLNRTRDSGLWQCGYPDVGWLNQTVIVYASPVGVKLVSSLSSFIDLGIESLTLKCRTVNCTFPAPNITWYIYNMTSTQISPYTVPSSTLESDTSPCTEQEAVYTSALELPHGTTIQGNIPLTTKFLCGLEHPTLGQTVEYSQHSNNVTFAVSVTSITLENSTTGTFVFYDGFSQKLKCTSSPSRPVPMVRWMLETQTGTVQLTDNITNTDVNVVGGLYVRTSEITLILEKENRHQKIFCSGNIDGQQIVAVSSKVTIDVWYQPTKPEVQEYGVFFPWLENENGTLKCVSNDYGNPTSNVSWISNRGITDTDGHLVIMGLMWSDNRKTISCELVNRYTIDKDMHAVSVPVNLNVEYFPRIQFNTTSPLTVNETQFLSVSCSATGNPNPDKIFWSGRPNGSLLRFENISRNDNGTYTCKATANSSKYGMLRSQMKFNIIVQYAPDVNVTVTGPAMENMTLTVLCEARGLPAEYTFHSWKQMWGDKVIRSDLQGTPSSNHNTLKLERLSLQDMGTYICSVDNDITGIDGKLIQTGTVHMQVMGIPTVLKEEEFHFAELAGHSINMSIPFYSNPAIESFIFQKNGTELQNNSRITVSLSASITDSEFYGIQVKLQAQMVKLFIQNLTQDDFDNYTLVLRNFLGTKKFRLQLDAAGPPWIVDIFHFNRFIEKQVEFNFKPGFNGGRNQTFAIEYRTTTSPDSPWMNSSVTDLKETQTYNGTYYVNVTQPPPGTYGYRMYSWNEIGRSPYSVVVTIFIPEVASTSANHGTSVAGIAGGVIAGFVIILIVVIGILLWRRYQHRKKNEHDTDVINEHKESVNVTRFTMFKKFGARKDTSGLDSKGIMLIRSDNTLEENRNPSIRFPEGDSYEKLHAYTNKDIQMYSSLNIPETSKDSEPKYENSVIK